MVITTTGFTTIAKAVAKAEGMADVRIGEYPGAVGVHAEELVVKNVENVLFERIVEHLTKPRDGGRGVAPAVSRYVPAWHVAQFKPTLGRKSELRVVPIGRSLAGVS